jgi:hypothetical protein
VGQPARNDDLEHELELLAARWRHPTTLRRADGRLPASGILADVLPEVPWSAFVEASRRAAAEAEPAD